MLDYTDEPFDGKCTYIAIDWDPTAYYLRYQTSSVKVNELPTPLYVKLYWSTQAYHHITFGFCLGG